MDEDQATKIIEQFSEPFPRGRYVVLGHTSTKLDGSFTVEQLEAIIWWMKNF